MNAKRARLLRKYASAAKRDPAEIKKVWMEIPRTAIVAISRQKPAFGKEAVSLAFLGSPSRWLLLDESYRARGPYGFERRVRALGIEPDDPAAFERAFGAAN